MFCLAIYISNTTFYDLLMIAKSRAISILLYINNHWIPRLDLILSLSSPRSSWASSTDYAFSRL